MFPYMKLYKNINEQTHKRRETIYEKLCRIQRGMCGKVLCTANTVFYCNRQQKVSVGMTTYLVFNTRVTYNL